jgi:hypothetical protein
LRDLGLVKKKEEVGWGVGSNSADTAGRGGGCPHDVLFKMEKTVMNSIGKF